MQFNGGLFMYFGYYYYLHRIKDVDALYRLIHVLN